ncbi:hypothetical protein [Paludibacterium denitrificans]|uniref:hypothetical protein n=1 Tax=Paludibacterium denitrificans TaxID=2675226 RepID=UPI0035E4307F
MGDLNATLVGSGQLAEPLAAKLALQFTPSRLSGAPLAGQARLVLTPGRLQQLNADLHLASNRLQANGAYGKAGDRLRLLIDAPALGLLGPGFARRGQRSGRAGRYASPAAGFGQPARQPVTLAGATGGGVAGAAR